MSSTWRANTPQGRKARRSEPNTPKCSYLWGICHLINGADSEELSRKRQPEVWGRKTRASAAARGGKKKWGSVTTKEEGNRRMPAASLPLRPPEEGRPGEKGKREADQTLQKLKSILNTADWTKPTHLLDSALTWLPWELKTHLESVVSHT